VLPRTLAKYRAGKIEPLPLVLFCPAARDLAASDGRFRLLEYDLLQPHALPCRVDVVRVMNVLNSSYFDPQQQSIAVRHIFESLALGGLLIIGSNDAAGTEVRGAIYRKLSQGFQVLAKSGADHDAHRTVMSCTATERDAL
jgi:CheR methyltransferase, SAM binding domain